MIWRICLTAIITAALSLFAWNAPRAQFNGCKAGFCNLAGATASSSPTYTYINTYFSTAGGSGISVSPALGSNPTCVAVVPVSIQDSPETVTVTLGGVSLNQDITEDDGIYTTFVFSGYLSSCTGTQTLTMTATTGNFLGRSLSVYVLTNLASHTVIQTAGYNNTSSATISVSAKDLMFAATYQLNNTPSCAGSTQAPANTHTSLTQDGQYDWIISSTNASFSLNCSTGTNTIAAAATYH